MRREPPAVGGLAKIAVRQRRPRSPNTHTRLHTYTPPMGLFGSSKKAKQASDAASDASASRGSSRLRLALRERPLSSSSRTGSTATTADSASHDDGRGRSRPKVTVTSHAAEDAELAPGEGEEGDETSEARKAQLRKLDEKAPNVLGADAVDDDETKANTKKNAMLFHFSDELIDGYRREHTASDLLGRLYYDDYDTENPQLLLGTATPLLTPQVTGESTSNSTLRLSSARPSLNRLSSFERGISFDTSDNNLRKTMTYKVKHPQFKFRRNNKTYLAGFNNLIESLKAIEWLFDEMIVHGDTIVVLSVLDEKRYSTIDRNTAMAALSKIENLNEVHHKKVKLIFEVAIGKPQKLLKNAINEYDPQMMIIGTRHYDRKMAKPLFAKELFLKHFLECALVPVILVKPTYHYVEELPKPIDGHQYFENWLRSIDVAGSYDKKRKKGMFSPLASRGNSYTNLSQLVPDRGPALSRGNSGTALSRGNSSPGLDVLVAERLAATERGRPRDTVHRERGRSPAPPLGGQGALLPPLRSRSRLRNRLLALFSIGDK